MNDSVGEQDIAITWCPLTASAVAFDRRVEGNLLTFGVSDQTGHRRNYERDPYADCHASTGLMFALKRHDARLPDKTLVFGLTVGNESVAYPLSALERVRELSDRIGGRRVQTSRDASSGASGLSSLQLIVGPTDVERAAMRELLQLFTEIVDLVGVILAKLVVVRLADLALRGAARDAEHFVRIEPPRRRPAAVTPCRRGRPPAPAALNRRQAFPEPPHGDPHREQIVEEPHGPSPIGDEVDRGSDVEQNPYRHDDPER